MPLRCPACSAEQQAPVDGARAICMRCGEALPNPQTGAAPAPKAARPDDFNQQTMSMMRPDLSSLGEGLPSLSALVAAAASEAQPPPGGEQKIWHIRTGAGADMGPATQQEVMQWQAAAKLDAETLAWRPGMEQWLPLAQALGQAPPPAPSSPPQDAAQITSTNISFLSPAGPDEATSADARLPTTVQASPAAARPFWKRPAAIGGAAAAVALAGAAIWFGRAPAPDEQQQASVVSHVDAPPAANPPAAPAPPAAVSPAAPAPPAATAAEVAEQSPPEAPGDGDDAAAPEPKRRAKKAKHKHRREHRRGHHRHD